MRELDVTGLVAMAAVLAGCAMAGEKPPSAVASLAPTQGNMTSGTVAFEAAGSDTVRVSAKVSGLKPNGEHGFHLHERGDCSAPDAMSAGAHYNPTAQPHGPPDAPHHAGDMPSLRANASGVAEAQFTIKGVSIGSGPADIVGRGVMVHASPDDYKTQPTGNSGARIACGVIARQH